MSDETRSRGTDASDAGDGATDAPSRSVGAYTWREFMREYGYGDEVARAYELVSATSASSGLFGRRQKKKNKKGRRTPSAADWERVSFDPGYFLGFPPEELPGRIQQAATTAARLDREFSGDMTETPVTKGAYTWEHFKWEYYYEDGEPPADGAAFDPASYLGFEPEETEERVETASRAGECLQRLVDRRTVNVNPEIDEEEFFSTADGHTTLVNRYDLEKSVSLEKKGHFFEVTRYWVDKPYAFVVIFHSLRENEKKYYLISPYCNEIERSVNEFLSKKLRTAIKYSNDDGIVRGSEEERVDVLERETHRLLDRYDLYTAAKPPFNPLARVKELLELLRDDVPRDDDATVHELDGISARPEPVVLEENPDTLSEYQVHKLLYLLKRDFLGYERIDGIKHDINVEDISCDGYESPVFVYHTDYEQIISNVYHGTRELDDFVIKLAQRSGKGISQRRPQVDAALPDGSRAQLTLGNAVSDHGTNYTIRQFKDVPFTPIDLINWHTFSLDEMAFLWLCIENQRSLIFAGGTASGKTTSLNAVSLFIPNNAKIVSIEDTREVELPQRNWVASVTRPAFGTSDDGDVDEFKLLEAALRQRPDYIVMGEVRGEEGRTLFQVMSTGHTTLTTFHADSVGEVLKRFTTAPINVSKSLFTSLDLVSVQTQTRIQGRKVRRNKTLTEINRYDPENDEINVQDVYQWDAEDDEYLPMGRSNTLQKIQFDRGWTRTTLELRLFERKVVLAYLVVNGLNEYTQVAATLQGFLNDPDTILTLMANGRLENHLEDLRRMESVVIDVDPAKEALVPRPDPGTETYEGAQAILDEAEKTLFPDYRGRKTKSLAEVLAEISEVDNVVLDEAEQRRLRDKFHDATVIREDEEFEHETAERAALTESLAADAPAMSDGGEDDEGENDATDEDDTERTRGESGASERSGTDRP